MSPNIRRLLFLLFFVSGFCSLVYQVVWVRMAFATFGITTPVLSVVISVFMLGLSAGSWAGGRCVAAMVNKTGLSAGAFYAGAELFIGLGAFGVPLLFSLGNTVLLSAGETNSIGYLSLSALVLAFSILPWCVCMGVTFPFMMAYVRERDPQNTGSFSQLYLANVLGAMVGTLLTAVVLVEICGFKNTLRIAAAGNFSIALLGGYLAWQQRGRTQTMPATSQTATSPTDVIEIAAPERRNILGLLFTTGFVAMAMEVIWTRAFSAILSTQVYSFASILFTYLGATFLGSWLYRRHLRAGSVPSTARLISYLLIAVFLPVVINDTRVLDFDEFSLRNAGILLASICPLCGVLGYLTPGLVDQYAGGHPARAGRAYAINVLGCILGPLFASYIMLPWLDERPSQVLLSVPLFLFLGPALKALPKWHGWIFGALAAALLVQSACFSVNLEDWVKRSDAHSEIRHDYAATVISTGRGPESELLVNGVGMTRLDIIPKFMVHLPLGFHEGKPGSVLIICFGMGTSHRSALSWDVNTTTVELVPSVVDAFGFYHTNAAQVRKNPRGRIVIDDGRRFLKRTRDQYDVIVTDPPPPVEAAGSSLLYSTEFYELAKQHLKPGGIVQTWLPGGDNLTIQAVIRSAYTSFRYVRCFQSARGWGVHLLASQNPIHEISQEEFVARMPLAAQKDLIEWNPSAKLVDFLAMAHEFELKVGTNSLLNPDLSICLTDDRPFNEYFLLRKYHLFTP